MAWLFVAVGVLIGAAMTALTLMPHRRTGNFAEVAESPPLPAEPLPVARQVLAPLVPLGAPIGDRLLSAFERLPIGLAVAGPDGLITYQNRMARSLTGVRHTDVLVIEATEAELFRALRGDEHSTSLELTGPPRRTVSIKAWKLGDDAAAATIEDVTERTRLDAVRTDFVANISHELKTPLGAVSLLAETLADEATCADADMEAVSRLATKVVSETQRLVVTVHDLLELARIELGEEPATGILDARTVVTEALERIGDVPRLRRVRVHTELPAERVPVIGDQRQLVSALTNLIDNAIKYSDPGSDISVAVRGHHQQVEFAVQDFGIGIPARDLDRIFERFYRVDRARSRGTGGTGLGLSIVRHVANNHGGEVSVTSVEGEGSTFVLSMPSEGAFTRV